MSSVYGLNCTKSSNHINDHLSQINPYTINAKHSHLTLNQVENIVIEMFRTHSEIDAYWYNISVGDTDNSIAKFLGISYSYFENLMLSLDLFYYYRKVNKYIRVCRNKIIS